MSTNYETATTIYTLLPTLQTSTATTAIINAHLDRAASVIDTRLSRRYAVPFGTTYSTTPPIIKTITQDIASFYTGRSLFSRDSQNNNDWVDSFWKSADDTIKAILDREIDVVDVNGAVLVEKSQADKYYSTTQNYNPISNLDPIENWKVDDSMAEAIEDSRDE